MCAEEIRMFIEREGSCSHMGRQCLLHCSMSGYLVSI